MRHYGIIGKPIAHSFSAKYFTEKFMREHIDAEYQLYPADTIADLADFCRQKQLSGLNVTIPYKQEVIKYLDALDDSAQAVGAVNVIKINNGKLIGYNTDTLGFRDSIMPLLRPWHTDALILGTGGAAKAVQYALNKLGTNTSFVSRADKFDYTYNSLNKHIISSHLLIVNCTPLGMYPATDECPAIPYECLTPQHLLFDVIYNPDITLFLKKGIEHNAATCNGLGMLHSQAEYAWKIWSKTIDF